MTSHRQAASTDPPAKAEARAASEPSSRHLAETAGFDLLGDLVYPIFNGFQVHTAHPFSSVRHSASNGLVSCTYVPRASCRWTSN